MLWTSGCSHLSTKQPPNLGELVQPFSAHLEHCRRKRKSKSLLQINHTSCVGPAYSNICYSEGTCLFYSNVPSELKKVVVDNVDANFNAVLGSVLYVCVCVEVTNDNYGM